ncbi:hypothetical protein MED15_03304 [Micromonospora noduli]|uniref:Sialate O-acetylesterase domain-containing protein n=1 Tax=Micromonospora noduli TaxID=709876 RepID=A0ABX9D2N7_9ACTN|nr:hypothetical protein MED15_03304 [Micromonospora noduli]RAO18553.1 hypothetical protein LUPAC07_02247 [Micromonospora noduli]RAO43177.1 hypothetical protein ONO86_03753 [Micromonospora noduli]
MPGPIPALGRLWSVPRLAWVAAGVVGLLVAIVVAVDWPPSHGGRPTAAWSAPEFDDAQRPVTPVDDTACSANAGGMAGFVPVSAVDLPERGDGRPPAPVFDKSATITGGFDRVGYCLELDRPTGRQWVWTAMAPFTDDVNRLGLPDRSDPIVRQRVADLEVATNVPGLTTGTGLTGYLEIWPNSYRPIASRQIPAASTQKYDADDDPQIADFYGSFQVHRVAANRPAAEVPQTILAVNGFTQRGRPLSLGIGSAPAGSSDWTFADNAGALGQRRLTVYARPALLAVDQHPADRQLYQRDEAGGATVLVAGRAVNAQAAAVRMKVVSGSEAWEESAVIRPGGAFSLRHRISAALRTYRIDLYVLGDGVHRRVARWEGVVAGDVYVIQGQSNAVAAAYRGSSGDEENEFIRSFGSPTPDPSFSAAERSWNYAVSDIILQPGSVGQWGIRTARRLVDAYQVPVAILNGGFAGKTVSYFQRSDVDPGDVRTNYGRLRQRLLAAGLFGQIRAVFWYQGEADRNDAAGHMVGFTNLLRNWRAELGTDSRYYVFQVRTSPCDDSSPGPLREAQRRMADTLGVTVLSTSGLAGRQNCHFAWEKGYRELGDQVFATVARDLYGGPAAGVAAPNPRSATFVDGRTRVVIQLRDNDRLTVNPGAAADFRITRSGVAVSRVEYRDGGQLELTLTGPASPTSGVSYVGRTAPGIVTGLGAGLLAFQDLPIGDA